MDLSTREAIRAFIEVREEFSFKRLDNNREYQQLSERQEKGREMVEKYYQNLKSLTVSPYAVTMKVRWKKRIMN